MILDASKLCQPKMKKGRSKIARSLDFIGLRRNRFSIAELILAKRARTNSDPLAIKSQASEKQGLS